MRGNLNAVKCIKSRNIGLILSIRARLACSVASACSAVYSWYLMRNSAYCRKQKKQVGYIL